jgi:hypothetical protein
VAGFLVQSLYQQFVLLISILHCFFLQLSLIPVIMSYTLSRTLANKLQGVDEAARRAASLPILLCHGKGIHNFLSYSNVWVLFSFNCETRTPNIWSGDKLLHTLGHTVVAQYFQILGC